MSKYASYSQDQLEELFSNYLIDSWSYSKVASFARNEKEFERTYIYQEKSRRSSTSVAGNAYHSALELFFTNLKKGEETSIVDMERKAFQYIDDIPANDWKIQKTTPTVEGCITKATKSASALIKNFYEACTIYTTEIQQVIGVEEKLDEWLSINGVDLPLPCHLVIDLIVKLKNGKTVIIDHKSKSKFTDDDELAFICGKQAITYIKGYESHTGEKVDEVWFVENKESQNKDGSPQVRKFTICLSDDTRKLYEAMLYEPLKRMIEAVSNPNYVYTINDSDNFVDRAELYNFWAKTMIAEVDDFNIQESKKSLIAQRQKKIRDASLSMINPKVISSFKENAESFITYDLTDKNMSNSEKIEHTLRTFGIIAKVSHEISGYSSNTYLLEFSAGVKISNVTKYKLDIANALNVPSVRMGENLVIYEGKSYFFIETSKKRTETLLWDAKYLEDCKIPIGIDNFGRTVVWDMNNHATPHMLICGATGSGKSVSIISTIKYALASGIEEVVIFDPKYEFCKYNSSHVKVYNEIEEIEMQMKILVNRMQERAKTGANSKILVVFDEFADAVSASRTGASLDIREEVIVGYTAKGAPKIKVQTTGRLKSLEENLKILLQKGRSLGFRIIAATQRASVNVITGDAKVNFPVQVCFRVPKEIDSKVVIDEAGAESLNGMGDGLMKSPEYLNIVRFQGFYAE
ncbi:DNA translocase FtsK [Phocaeicola sp.]